MPIEIKPSYPVYVISKGRWEQATALTARLFLKDGVDFKLVVEPQESEKYAVFGEDRLLILPFSNLGLGSIPARNWVMEHSKNAGHKRHWIWDDNIRTTYRRYKTLRIPCNSNIAMALIEQFTDRYSNIGISGMNYAMFVPDRRKISPFFLNCHVYSNLLIDNSMDIKWRGRYNEDTDLCLQALASNYCTVLFNAFCVAKMQTMKMKGGNSTDLYKGDGRAIMARSLEMMWPGVVETKRLFGRPQHSVKYQWKKFDTQLKLKDSLERQTTLFDESKIDLVKVTDKDDELSKEIKEIYESFTK